MIEPTRAVFVVGSWGNIHYLPIIIQQRTATVKLDSAPSSIKKNKAGVLVLGDSISQEGVDNLHFVWLLQIDRVQ